MSYSIYTRKVLVWIAITTGFTLTAAAVGRTPVYQPGAKSTQMVQGYQGGRINSSSYRVTTGSGSGYKSPAYARPQSSATYNAGGVYTGSGDAMRSYGGSGGDYGYGRNGYERYAAGSTDYGQTGATGVVMPAYSAITRRGGTLSAAGGMSPVQEQYNMTKRRGYGNGDEEDYSPFGEAGSEFGEKRVYDGVWYSWSGSSWERLGAEVEGPLGDAPWPVVILMVMAYIILRKRRETE